MSKRHDLLSPEFARHMATTNVTMMGNTKRDHEHRARWIATAERWERGEYVGTYPGGSPR